MLAMSPRRHYQNNKALGIPLNLLSCVSFLAILTAAKNPLQWRIRWRKVDSWSLRFQPLLRRLIAIHGLGLRLSAYTLRAVQAIFPDAITYRFAGGTQRARRCGDIVVVTFQHFLDDHSLYVQ